MIKYIISFLLISNIVYAKSIRVMVLDTGVDASHLALIRWVEAGSYDNLNDTVGHGTHVAGIIVDSGCPNLKIVSCKFTYNGGGVFNKLYDCLNRALMEHIDIINFSGGFYPDDREFELF